MEQKYYLAWLFSLASLIGSLYFSEVQGLAPCILCWWQRALMYPLVVVILVGIWRKDTSLPYYVLPLSILGSLTALFQYLLQMKVLSTALLPCREGIPCDAIDFSMFGFVTIPFLSLVAFVAISILMYLSLRDNQK